MIKPALTGAILTMAVLAFGQSDSNSQKASAQIINNNSTTVAVGENSEATGNYAIAIGNGASADMDNTMVLGGHTLDDRVSVGIGTSYPNSLSSLDLADIDKGLLVNRLSSEQAEIFKMALGIADEGMMIYNTTDHLLMTWDGLKWDKVQTKKISLAGHRLKIDNGPSVDLSQYQQDLTSATLNGKELTIEIENGTDVKVDLSLIFKEYEARLAAIEHLLSVESEDEFGFNKDEIDSRENLDKKALAELSQNIPNPFSTSTKVTYTIPEGSASAYIEVLNTAGGIVSKQKLSPISGTREKTIFADGMAPGVYYLSLYVDHVKTNIITMIVR
ncbi:MAG: hypothetical protein ACJA0U_002122 [Salibacteraceae bacterium]|jgi:hypothetical protein